MRWHPSLSLPRSQIMMEGPFEITSYDLPRKSIHSRGLPPIIYCGKLQTLGVY